MIVSFASAALPRDQNPAIRELGHLVPSGNLEGWFIKGAGAIYVSANLFLYINGQAEMYLDYGFQSLRSSEYVHEKQQGTIVVDIYDMGDKDHAFGVYGAERDESAQKLDIGAEAYQSGQVLNFWKGPYYVKISVLGKIADAGRVLPLFARAAARTMPGDALPPDRAQRLEQDGLIAGSMKFSPKSFMGHSFLKDTYSAEYTLPDGGRVRMFIADYPGPGQARAAFDKYRDFLSRFTSTANPKVYQELPGFGESAFLYADQFGKEHIVVKQGKNLCGASGGKLGNEARSLLKKIIP